MSGRVREARREDGGMVALMIYRCLVLAWLRTAAAGGRHAIGQEHND